MISVGEQVQASTGFWLGNPTAFAYQWQSSSTGVGDGADIVGATRSDYITTGDDSGLYLRVGVTASNAGGSSAVVYSDWQGPVGVAAGATLGFFRKGRPAARSFATGRLIASGFRTPHPRKTFAVPFVYAMAGVGLLGQSAAGNKAMLYVESGFGNSILVAEGQSSLGGSGDSYWVLEEDDTSKWELEEGDGFWITEESG